MSAVIGKKERNKHNRQRKQIILAVTKNISISADEVATCLAIEKTAFKIIILRTDLKGQALKRAVNRYMKDKTIKRSYGDKVVYLDEQEGGDAIDCVKTK